MNRFDHAKGLVPEEPPEPSKASDIIEGKKREDTNTLYLSRGRGKKIPIYPEDLNVSFNYSSGPNAQISLAFQITPEQSRLIFEGYTPSQPESRQRRRRELPRRNESGTPTSRAPDDDLDDFLGSL